MKRAVILVVTVLALCALACGGDGSGEKVDEVAPSPPPTLMVYGVGDVIRVQEHTIVLNSASLDDAGTLTANFTLENGGGDDLTVSSLLRFSAKAGDGQKLEVALGCSPTLDGTVLPGDKLGGNVCWRGCTTDVARIYYEASLLGSGAVVWEVTK